MAKDEQPKSIAPGSLAAGSGSPFLLSRAEWLVVQRYVANVLALPITEPDLRTALEMPATMDGKDFNLLLDGYKKLAPPVKKWKEDTFPATVKLANDIVAYGSEAPIYYGGITSNVNKLLLNRDDASAKAALAAIIKRLAAQAGEHVAKANKVYADVKLFAEETGKAATLLDNLAEHYGKKFGDNSDRAKDLQKELQEVNDLITQATEEYEFDKAMACSTPAYAWIVVPPIGLIAAIIVAGIYGDKAVKARDRLNRLKKDLATLAGDLKFAFNLIGSISLGTARIVKCQSAVHAALPVIQRIQGAWQAIQADLVHVGELIDKNIDQAILEIKDLGVESAIEQWRKLAVTADAYRANAFIEEQPPNTPPVGPAPTGGGTREAHGTT